MLALPFLLAFAVFRFAEDGRGKWLLLCIFGVGGVFVLLAGLELLIAREREQLAKRLFGEVEVLRTGGVVDRQRLSLRSKHGVREPVRVEYVEFTVVLLEATDRVTVARRSAIKHLVPELTCELRKK